MVAEPERTAVITDFDGTLSPIVRDPAAAKPVDGAADVLHALARRFGTVAVVSGRPVEFLRDRLDVAAHADSGLTLYGLYGLEWLDPNDVTGPAVIHPEAVAWRAVVDEAATWAEAAAPDGVGVERKGFSVTLHVRGSPELAAWARTWSEATAATTGLALHPARMSSELRPPVAIDKGTVVDGLLDDAAAACFLGDDLGDLPGYDALDRHAARTGATVVRVGVRSDEAPPELLARADVVVDGPPGALAFLRSLL